MVVHSFALTGPARVTVRTLSVMTSTTTPSSARTGDQQPVAQPLVITGDESLLDPVLAACASADVHPVVVGDPGGVRQLWAAASAVIIGVDQAHGVSRLVLPRRDRVILVGDLHRQVDLCRWSVPLDASVIMVPEGASGLAPVLAGVRGGGDHGVVVTMVGGSGGIGTSTTAAGLAWAGARRGLATLLVDLDPIGGGVDLLIGIEQLDGWRWPRLRSASGQLGDLRGQLPQLEEMDVLSMGRGEVSEPTTDAVTAVLSSAGHSHGLVVLDLGRDLGPSGREAVRLSDVTILLAGTDVRSLAAAQHTADLVRPLARDLRVVARIGRVPGGVSPAVVAESVEAPLLGAVPDDPRLRLAAEHGDPPGRASRPRWNRSIGELLDRLVAVPA